MSITIEDALREEGYCQIAGSRRSTEPEDEPQSSSFPSPPHSITSQLKIYIKLADNAQIDISGPT